MKGKNAGNKNGMYGKKGELSINSIPVYEFDNTIMIKKYSCVRECSEYLNIDSSLLSSYLNKGVLKVGNLYYSKSNILTENDINCSKLYKKLKVGISQYDLNGDLITHYDYLNQVNNTGLVRDSTLRNHKDKPWKYNGYIWVFDNIKCSKKDIINASETIKIFKSKNNSSILKTTIVHKFNMNGEFISSYSSFADAIKNNDIIQNDLRHLHKGPWIAKGFIWAGDNNKLRGLELAIAAAINVNKYTHKLPYFQFDLNGDFTKLYISQNDMKKHIGLSRDTIIKYTNKGPIIYKNIIITDLSHLYPIDNIKNRVYCSIVSKTRNK